MLDIFSRDVVGWIVEEREHSELAQALIAGSCAKQGIEPEQLSIHSDRGPPDDVQVSSKPSGRPRRCQISRATPCVAR